MSSQPAPDLFRRACAQWATGIAIITALDDSGLPHGMTVNSFTSVSLDPPLILLCVDRRATLLPLMTLGREVVINILAEQQQDLSGRFANRIEDRFEDLEWHEGENRAPVFPGTLVTLECVIEQNVEAGDHTVVIAKVKAASYREGRPLLYFNSSYETLA